MKWNDLHNLLNFGNRDSRRSLGSRNVVANPVNGVVWANSYEIVSLKMKGLEKLGKVRTFVAVDFRYFRGNTDAYFLH